MKISTCVEWKSKICNYCQHSDFKYFIKNTSTAVSDNNFLYFFNFFYQNSKERRIIFNKFPSTFNISLYKALVKQLYWLKNKIRHTGAFQSSVLSGFSSKKEMNVYISHEKPYNSSQNVHRIEEELLWYQSKINTKTISQLLPQRFICIAIYTHWIRRSFKL